MTKIGELFAGYGGLGQGVQTVIGGEIAWFSEFDDAPSKILAHHFPGVPNHGDITKIDWSTVEPVDVLTGGFPCQDVSLAGARRGLREGTRSGLWSYFAEAIDALKPELVVIENVRGLLSAEATSPMEPDPWDLGNGTDGPTLRAIGAVLGNLSELGYDAQWVGVRAADAGAPHGRFRVFIVAHPDGRRNLGRAAKSEQAERHHEAVGPDQGVASATDAVRVGRAQGDHPAGISTEGADRAGVANERSARSGGTEWGAYRPAIERWETVLGRPAPPPTKGDGRDGSHRLSAEFVEWMLGLEPGWATDPAIGLTRNQQLKALGNGVVPQQAAMAIGYLLRGQPAHD